MKKRPGWETAELREFEEVIRGRRTINLYLQTRVPGQLVRNAIDAAIWAPNHHLTEPWSFYLLGPDTIALCIDLLRQIVTEKNSARAAEFKAKAWSEKPGWLVVTCRISDDELRQREDYAACSAAVQNVMLFLWNAGVGTKWTTGDITRDPRFSDIVGLDPDREFVVGLIWYGYPKLTPSQSRKGVAQVLTELP
jgi:nitroreductase